MLQQLQWDLRYLLASSTHRWEAIWPNEAKEISLKGRLRLGHFLSTNANVFRGTHQVYSGCTFTTDTPFHFWYRTINLDIFLILSQPKGGGCTNDAGIDTVWVLHWGTQSSSRPILCLFSNVLCGHRIQVSEMRPTTILCASTIWKPHQHRMMRLPLTLSPGYSNTHGVITNRHASWFCANFETVFEGFLSKEEGDIFVPQSFFHVRQPDNMNPYIRIEASRNLGTKERQHTMAPPSFCLFLCIE